MSIIKQNSLLFPDRELDPDLILIRPELKELQKMQTLEHPIKYVFGVPGTGKTTLIKYFLNTLTKKENAYIFIDCRFYSTFSKLEKKLYEGLVEINPELALYKDNIVEGIIKGIQQSKINIYIVLDEINIPIFNHKAEPKHYPLHYFLRLPGYNKENKIKIIFTTNIYQFENHLGREVTSMYSPLDKITFKPYDVVQLSSILTKRAQYALEPNSYTQDDIFYISKTIFQDFNQNARDAVLLLGRVAEKAEVKLDRQHIDSCVQEMHLERTLQEINSFNNGEKLFLKAICLYSKELQNDMLSGIGMVKYYSAFMASQHPKQKKASMNTLYYYMREIFEKTQVIIHLGRRPNGRAHMYQLQIDPDITLKQLEYI